MSDEKNLELQALDKQIAQTHDFQHKVLIPLEAKEKERRILLGQIKAAETRARAKAERDAEKAKR